MAETTIFVRLLGEPVDCWRAVDTVPEGEHYQIVGPEHDSNEEWEFEIGEVVQCRTRRGQLVAVELVRSVNGKRNLARPLSLRDGRTDARRRNLVEAVAAAIDDADPMGLLAAGAPADEYGLEVETIFCRLPRADDLEDVVAILHEEFSRWFGIDSVGPRGAYVAPATRIWEAVCRYRYAD